MNELCDPRYAPAGDVRLALFPTGVVFPSGECGQAGTVAVIMRTRNRPVLLHRALSSVLCQTYGAWRLYLVNDGGDRADVDSVLRTYAGALGDRLTLIHHVESRGMENASNAALAAAEEEFVAVHDDDDSWHPEFLQATTAFLADPANSHCVAVTTGCALVTEQIVGGLVEERHRSEWVHNKALTDFSAMLAENSFPPISMLFRRAAVNRIGGFNGALPVLGDWDFNIRLLTLGEIDYLDRMLANYHHRVKAAALLTAIRWWMDVLAMPDRKCCCATAYYVPPYAVSLAL